MNFIVEDLLERLLHLPYHPYKNIYGYFPKELSRKNVQLYIHRMEKKGFIEKGLVEDEICIKLTELGTKKLEKLRMKNKETTLLRLSTKKAKWDGKWRVVVFDIPETNKRVREVLRQALRVLEFKPLQKSVWVSKRNYITEIRNWIRELNLDAYILVFETSNLGIKE